MKYRRTVAAFEALLLLFLVEFIDGQNVVLHVDSCYEVGADMTITAEYTGSDTFSNVEWFYSDQTSNNIVIITSTCTVLGSIGAGFPTPVSRISFQCPSTGLPQHNYTLTVEGVTEAELTNKKWGAKFVLDSSPEEQDEKNVTICPPTTTDAPGEAPGKGQIFANWKIVIIIIFAVVFTTTVTGCFLDRFCNERRKSCFDCEASDCCKCCQCCDNNCVRCKCCGSCCNIDGLPFWYHILWWTVIGTPVSLGIFISRKCRKQAENPGDSEGNKESKEMDGQVTNG